MGKALGHQRFSALKLPKLAAAIQQRFGIVPAKVLHLANHNVVIARVHQLVQRAIKPCHGFRQTQAFTGLTLHWHIGKSRSHVASGKLPSQALLRMRQHTHTEAA